MKLNLSIALHFLLPAHIVWGTKQESRNVQSSAHTWSYVQVSFTRAQKKKSHRLVFVWMFTHRDEIQDIHWFHSVCFFSASLKCVPGTTIEVQLLWKLEGGLNCKSSLSSSWLQWWPPAALYCNAACHWAAPVSSWSAPLILLWGFAARTQLRAADTLYEGTSHLSLIGNVTPALLFGQDIMFGPHQHVMTSVVAHSQCYSQNKFKVI